MSRLTPQGKLGLKLLAGVFAFIAVFAVVLATRDDTPPPRELAGVTVASIVFEVPTDAWVSPTGTAALVADGAGFRLATYGPGGEIESSAIEYAGGECYWCSSEPFEQPVLTDLHDGTWEVATTEMVAVVDQPSGWDGRPPAAGLDPSGRVVIVAGLDSGDTAVIDEKLCTVKGTWTLVAASAETMLLHRVDADRRDYSVSKFDRCG